LMQPLRKDRLIVSMKPLCKSHGGHDQSVPAEYPVSSYI
jgi:hypothetical protein